MTGEETGSIVSGLINWRYLCTSRTASKTLLQNVPSDCSDNVVNTRSCNYINSSGKSENVICASFARRVQSGRLHASHRVIIRRGGRCITRFRDRFSPSLFRAAARRRQSASGSVDWLRRINCDRSIRDVILFSRTHRVAAL